MKLTSLAFFVLGLASGAGGIYYLTDHGQSALAPGPAARPVRPLLTASALGRVQPSGGILSIGVSLPDRLAKLLVEEGQEVKEGDVLAKLGSHGDRALELAILDSQINEAEQRL